MFSLFKTKKNEPTSSASRTTATDGAAPSTRKDIKPKFEIKADFGGINGWPADVSVVNYLSAQGLICAGTESGALLVFGQSFQYYRPHPPGETICVKRILSVGIDICLVVYNDNSLALFRLPTLELLDSLEGNWLTNSNDYPGIELSCIHVDEYAEKSLRTFVYVGTSIGDIYVIEVSTTSGSVRVCDFMVSLKDVEITSPMRVTAIVSDEKCLMVGYEMTNIHHEDSDRASDLDMESCPASPGSEFSNRFNSAIGEMPVPAASSKCMGVVVVFNITKRRVRHSYITSAGVSFLLMDSLGDALYAVLRTGEILSLVACSGKSQYSSIWSVNLLSNDSDYYSDDTQQIVKQIKWLPPQTSNNHNSAAGCYFLLLNNDNIVCLSPSGAQGKMTEITSMRPQTCEEISDIHIVPVGQAKKAGIIDKKKDLSQNGSVSYANAGLLVVTKRIPSDAYYKAKRNETGSMVSIGNERYRSNTESQMVSRGAYLRIIPCPAGISMIPSAASGATAIEVAVAIAVAITEPSPPSSVTKEKSKSSSSSSYSSNIDLPFFKESSLTCINALPPCTSSSSMATVLLNLSHIACDDQEESKKRDIALIKQRSCSHNGQSDLFGDSANIVRNEVVLAQKDVNSQRQSKYEFDLLFLGQKNGTLSVWACSPTFGAIAATTASSNTAAQASNRADQTGINQSHKKAYHAMWRQVFTFDCISSTKDNISLSQGAFSPSSSPVCSPMSNFFSPPAPTAIPGNVWVTVISPDEGAGLFAVGTSDGSVIVWEVCQSDSSMGCVEYLARINGVGKQYDSYQSEGTRSRDRSVSNSNSPSPQTSIKNLVFSWDDDEDDEEEANDDDDDEEEVEADAAIVYDVRKSNNPTDKVLSDLIRRGQEEKDSRFEMKSREGSSRGSNKYPDLDTASLSLKMNLVLKNNGSDSNNNGSDSATDYFAENGPFQPDDVRTAFRAKVSGSITSLLLLSDCLMLVVGTSEGAVWVSRGMDDQSMAQINLSGMWKVSSKNPGSASSSDIFVAGLYYSVYSSDCDTGNSRDIAAPIPVVYVAFSCGNIAVICLQTLSMVAYCVSDDNSEGGSGLSSILKKRSGGGAKKSSNDSHRDSTFNEFDGSDNEGEVDSTILSKTVISCTVTDSSHTVMKSPQYKGAYIIKELDGGKKGISLTFLSLHGAAEPTPSVSSPATSRKYDSQSQTAREDRDRDRDSERGSSRPRSQSSVDAYSSNNGSSKTSPRQYHSQLPRYLLIAVGTSIVTYDLGKFCKASSSAGRSRRSYSIISYSGESSEAAAEVTYTSVRSGVQSSQTVCSSPIIAARHFNYTDKVSSSSSYLSSSPSSPSPSDSSCLTFINGFGKMPTISIKEKTKLSDDDLYQKCGEFKVSQSIMSPSKDERNLRKERESESLYRDEMNSTGSEPAIPFNASLKAGVLLSNGSCYLLQRNGLLLHYNFSESNTHSVSGKLPSRLSSSITTLPPSSSLHISIDHESKITNYQNAFRGKQSSMFGVTVHSGPADLVKLFSKTRDKNHRREKIKFEKPSLKSISSLSSSLVCSKDDNEKGSERVDRDRDRDRERETVRDVESVAGSPTIRNRMSLFVSNTSRDRDRDRDRSTTANTKSNSDSVTSTMSEAMRNLEERGENLRRINNQADELNDGAHRFRDLIKQQKQDLQKKANRWGL